MEGNDLKAKITHFLLNVNLSSDELENNLESAKKLEQEAKASRKELFRYLTFLEEKIPDIERFRQELENHRKKLNILRKRKKNRKRTKNSTLGMKKLKGSSLLENINASRIAEERSSRADNLIETHVANNEALIQELPIIENNNINSVQSPINQTQDQGPTALLQSEAWPEVIYLDQRVEKDLVLEKPKNNEKNLKLHIDQIVMLESEVWGENKGMEAEEKNKRSSKELTLAESGLSLMFKNALKEIRNIEIIDVEEEKIDLNKEQRFVLKKENWSGNSVNNKGSPNTQIPEKKKKKTLNDLELFPEDKNNYNDKWEALQKECNLRKFLLPFHDRTKWDSFFVPILMRFKGREVKKVSEFAKNMISLIQVHYEIPNVQSVKVSMLQQFLDKLSTDDKSFFFEKLNPFLASLVLDTSKIFPEGLQVLEKNMVGQVTISKQQVNCLVANMFFCTIPNIKTELNSDQYISKNFSELFGEGTNNSEIKLQKLACLFNYFKRLYQSPDSFLNLNVMYERISYHKREKTDFSSERFWLLNDNQLSEVECRETGKIEDNLDSIQICFANKILGGMLFSDSCSSEQIRYFISPELFPLILIMDNLDDNEAVIIYGAESYSSYEGFGPNFKFLDSIRDNSEIDIFNRKDLVIAAIDAANYREKTIESSQFDKPHIMRELSKAYLGFKPQSEYLFEEMDKKSIATGPWGSGAFGGNPKLKFIIQWLAASEAKRNLIFYTYKDESLKGIERLIADLKTIKHATIGKIFKALLSKNKDKGGDKQCLFEYLINNV